MAGDGRARLISREERIQGQGVLDIGEDQLLVLLLVLEAHLHQPAQGTEVFSPLQEPLQGAVDVPAVFVDFVQRWTRKRPL